WSDALAEAEEACVRLSQPTPKPALGSAYYQVAEVHRISGRFAEAEETYSRAQKLGHSSQPGSSLLRLAQGKADAAKVAIRRSLKSVKTLSGRARMLEALIEIALATDDLAAARSACDQLEEIAAQHGAPLLRAIANRSAGAVLLAEGDPATASAC